MLAVEVQRLFEIILHVVANSYLVNSDFGALEVIEQLCAEIQPFQEFDGSVVFASVLLDECHAKGHMCFSLNISHFYTRSRFHLHILKLAHLILCHTFQRKPSWHDLIHQAEVLRHLNRQLAWKWAGSLRYWHGFTLIVLSIDLTHNIKLILSALFLFFFQSLHFIIVHLIVDANVFKDFTATILELQRDVWVAVCMLILSQEDVLALEQVHITLELFLLDLEIIERFLNWHHQYFIESIFQGILLKLVDTWSILSLLYISNKFLGLRDLLFFIRKSLRLDNLIQKLKWTIILCRCIFFFFHLLLFMS